MNRPIAPEVVEAELARLPDMSLDELKARWLELKGVPLPKFMRRGLITRAVAHAIEERATGGLDRETRKRLEQLMRQIVPSGERPPPAPKRIKVGTRLLREWQGRVHEVTVAADGFTWNGVRHRSLSDIARRITGTRWSAGPANPAGSEPRSGSKQALVISLLERPTGATLDDLVKATGWLPHTTRAALTALRHKGHAIERLKSEAGNHRVPAAHGRPCDELFGSREREGLTMLTFPSNGSASSALPASPTSEEVSAEVARVQEL